MAFLGADGGLAATSRRFAEAFCVDEAFGGCGVVLRVVGFEGRGWEAFLEGGGGLGGLALPPFCGWFVPGRA